MATIDTGPADAPRRRAVMRRVLALSLLVLAAAGPPAVGRPVRRQADRAGAAPGRDQALRRGGDPSRRPDQGARRGPGKARAATSSRQRRAVARPKPRCWPPRRASRCCPATRRRLKASLKSRNAVLVEVIASLQRMGQHPPPALLVRPEDALEAVRTAMLLGSVLPEMRRETQALADRPCRPRAGPPGHHGRARRAQDRADEPGRGSQANRPAGRRAPAGHRRTGAKSRRRAGARHRSGARTRPLSRI